MARRSDHTREELHELALVAAREVAEQEGLRGLSARRVAREIGYTIGTIYNLFDDLDDLIVQMNGHTLDSLYEACAAAAGDGEPAQALHALADSYIGFIREHPRLWNVLFEHHLPDDRALPDWHYQKVLRLLALVENALTPFFPPGQEAERHHSARVLWSSLHGICSLESMDKLIKTESVEHLSETLIETYLAGLRSKNQAGA